MQGAIANLMSMVLLLYILEQKQTTIYSVVTFHNYTKFIYTLTLHENLFVDSHHLHFYARLGSTRVSLMDAL